MARVLRPSEPGPAIGWDLGALAPLIGGADPAADPPWTLADDAPPPGSELRLIYGVFEDESVLCVAALRPPGAEGHGDAVAALLTRPNRETAHPRALISTEYDAEGRVRRAGVELVEDPESPPLRVSADRTDGREAGRDGLRGEVVAMRLRMEGIPGNGVYELMRA